MGAGDSVSGRVLAGGRLTGGVGAGIATLVDIPRLVDQEVVANVAPALGDRVVVVDRADRRSRIRVVVLRVRVVDDQLLDRTEGGRPDLLAGRVVAERLVGPPVDSRRDLRLRD